MTARCGGGSAPPSPARPLRGAELALTAAAVTAAYGGGLYALHCWSGARGSPNYWGTLPSAWDHPEPNYVVSAAIGEFWSVLTTIPVAGALLAYQGLKYRYGAKVVRIYALTCAMYSLAFSAHLTLQKLVFSTTVTAVMSNALLTFAEFSGVVHRTLRSPWLRWAVVFLGEALLVATVATLPYALSANGGVWTLFVVQSPGVFLATALAAGLAWRAKGEEERTTYRTVCIAGSLLSSAMLLSLVECLIGFEYGYISSLWGFPWLHIAIHVFEQVGIYVFGVGVAALHELLLRQPARAGAEVRYVGSFVPYLYCPYLPGPAPILLGKQAPLPRESAETKHEAQPEPAEGAVIAVGEEEGGGAAGGAAALRGRSGEREGPHRRRRDQTPGAPGRAGEQAHHFRRCPAGHADGMPPALAAVS